MPPKRSLSPDRRYPSTSIYRSSQILDRSSRFIALYSLSLTARELQSLPEVSNATHRIAAWRSLSSQSTLNSSQRVYETGHDDDGEKYGGKALASVLSDLNVEGAVVVARWYGGVMLGPVRFDHIKKCAREAITEYISSSTPEQQSKKAKRIVEDDTKRNDLIRILPERDQSISVLRGLLAEKQASITTSSPKTEVQKGSSPAKVPDYTKLPLSALENLERARDATIGWILGQIEKAEAAQDALSTASQPVVKKSQNGIDDNEIEKAETSLDAISTHCNPTPEQPLKEGSKPIMNLEAETLPKPVPSKSVATVNTTESPPTSNIHNPDQSPPSPP
ncbi:MAG: hypothetical protein L6R40_007278 [Gallowayella cf. fulva]|nr:MAG: hypothetical protein L6R40_007278 [Xanthomendoza cf. fulva]